MLAAKRRGVSVEDRMIVPRFASGKDRVGDRRSPEEFCRCKCCGVLEMLKTLPRTDKDILDPIEETGHGQRKKTVIVD